MSVYKDEKNNTYYCSFYYKDYNGQTKRKLKRGFALARLAKQWENEFLAKRAHTPATPFSILLGQFIEDMESKIKPSTLQLYKQVIKNNIAAFFGNMPINEISPAIIRQWQLEQTKQGYALTTLASMQKILTRVFSYACQYNGLDKNPCSVAGGMGSSKPHNFTIWTITDFNAFIDTLQANYKGRAPKNELITVFKTLFYTGIRIGELIALTVQDYNPNEKTLNINKNCVFINGRETPQDAPKTSKSVRLISLPGKLCETLNEHINKLQSAGPSEKLFPFITRKMLFGAINTYAAAAGVPRIRIHDIRHSHASLLINNNVQPLAISERLGHENITITLSVYAHLYTSTNKAIADTLDKLL